MTTLRAVRPSLGDGVYGPPAPHGVAGRPRQHVLSVLVENQPGVLTRIAGLFARRGFNITSLAVGETYDPELSRMTICVDAASAPLEQVTKQLYKLINVLKITELEPAGAVERELMLITVGCEPDRRAEVVTAAELFAARVVSVGQRSLSIEVTGTSEKIAGFVAVMAPYGILDVARTGLVAIAKGA